MKGSLIEFSLGNTNGISVFGVVRIRSNADKLSKLQAIYLFNDLDKLEKLVLEHYRLNNVILNNKFDLKNCIIYLMIRYLYQDRGNEFCSFVFKTLADNDSFFDFYTRIAHEVIVDIDNELKYDIVINLIDKEKEPHEYNAVKECIEFIRRVHYKLIASVELIIRPHLYKRIDKRYRESYKNGSFVPYNTPITFIEYISKLVNGNSKFIAEKLPRYLEEQLLAYESIYNQYMTIKMKYLKI